MALKNDNEEIFLYPKACQFPHTSLPSNENILGENPEWLIDHGSMPLWSRLKPLNTLGQQREFIKQGENNFMVEIPGRLLSLFGTAKQQTDCLNKMENMNRFHLMSNCFILYAALKYDFKEWSENLMNKIISDAVAQYPVFLKSGFLTDKEVNINHFNRLFSCNGDEFKVQLYQAATGILYIPYGLRQFNLARALTWFFNRYQFGFIKCGTRTLAMGKILNNDYGFFMYDCQSRGYPLFDQSQANSYILRTPYLQILLYCLLKTFNFSEKINFVLYNVDITIMNPFEMKTLKQTVNKSMTSISSKSLLEQKVSFSRKYKDNVPKLKEKNEQKPVKKPVQKLIQKPLQKSSPKTASNNLTCRKPNAHKDANNSKSQTFKENKKIPLDPNKMYYIIAVPKSIDKIEANHLTIPNGAKAPSENYYRQKNMKGAEEFERETFLKSTNLQKSDSTVTLTAESVEEVNVIKEPKNSGLKVYLVDNTDIKDINDQDNAKKIKIAHQLKDLFTK